MHECEYLLIGEVAEITRAPVWTVRCWIRAGLLPSTRPGLRRLVRRDDLEKFLAKDILAEHRAAATYTIAEEVEDDLIGALRHEPAFEGISIPPLRD